MYSFLPLKHLMFYFSSDNKNLTRCATLEIISLVSTQSYVYYI